MAHEFTIKPYGLNVDHRKIGYFDGLAKGLLYEAFDMHHHYCGWSGDNIPETISREKALECLDKALAQWENLHYPDQTRIDDLREFRARCDSEFKDVHEFVVCFS